MRRQYRDKKVHWQLRTKRKMDFFFQKILSCSATIRKYFNLSETTSNSYRRCRCRFQFQTNCCCFYRRWHGYLYGSVKIGSHNLNCLSALQVSLLSGLLSFWPSVRVCPFWTMDFITLHWSLFEHFSIDRSAKGTRSSASGYVFIVLLLFKAILHLPGSPSVELKR